MKTKMENPQIVEYYNLNQEDVIAIVPQQNCMLFLNRGCMSISYSNVIEKEITYKQMILLTSGTTYLIRCIKKVDLVLFYFSLDVTFCQLFSNNMYFDEKNTVVNDSYLLRYDRRVSEFIKSLLDDVRTGISSSDFFSAKTVELSYLLKNRYTKQELSMFFCPIFTNDQTFSTFVRMNYQKVKNIREFAELSCYSVSGFEKRFKRVFGEAASKWVKDQRANDMLREMHTGEKSLKQIMSEYGFFSASHFNNFCKKRLGHTPGQLIKHKSVKTERQVL